ncbi:hypothetical protein KKF82_04820 [Patescibacteria group bacterium]|nr:hypothetical protein [Patescibacteria group bacterium]
MSENNKRYAEMKAEDILKEPLYIRFNEQFDKLKDDHFQVGKTFTSYVPYTSDKDLFYTTNKNNEFEVIITNSPFNGAEPYTIGKAIIIGISYCWSDELSEEEIHQETYHTYSQDDWNYLIKKLYDIKKVFGIYLTLTVTSKI